MPTPDYEKRVLKIMPVDELLEAADLVGLYAYQMLRSVLYLQFKSDPVLALAILYYGEGLDQLVDDDLAIMATAVNSAKDRGKYYKEPWLKWIAAEVLRPLKKSETKMRFSAFNKPTNRAALKNLIKLLEHDDDAAWVRAKAAANYLIFHMLSGFDPSNGAVNYLHRDLYYSDKCPSWAKKMEIAIELGAHVFLRKKRKTS